MQQPDLSRLLALLQSPAGQQLVSYLKENGGAAARTAAAQAGSGDLSAAKNTLGPLLEDPAVRSLLQQLGGMP